MVLVYGATNATLVGALVGAKRNTVVAHVDSGLQSSNRCGPEAINRILADHCSGLLFIPSERMNHQLVEEGINEGVYNTGDVKYTLAVLDRPSNINDRDRLDAIIEVFVDTARTVVLPSNPRLQDALETHGWAGVLPRNIHRIGRLGYLDYVRLLDGADRVATDAGRTQKEPST